MEPTGKGALELCVGDAQGALFAQELSLRERVLARPVGRVLADVRFPFEAHSDRLWALRSGELIGCVLFYRSEPDAGRLYQMAIAPEAQGQGVGRALVEHLHGRLAQRDVRTVYLHARAGVVGFYERLGYLPDGPPFAEVGIEHQRMSRALSQPEENLLSRPR